MATQGELFAAPVEAPLAFETQPAATPVVALVDASGLIFRAYHALPPLTTSKGIPTHAALGFTRMVLKLLRERAPTHLVLCFDKDSRKGRLAIDPNYKAHREAPPGDLISQFELIRNIADVLGWSTAEMPGWEADDVIATLSAQAKHQHFDVEIITSDKDFLQLLAPGVRIFDPMKDKDITEADALERFGVRSEQMRDYQALVGDAVDNIPKVPGIGPKTAADLLAQFGSVEVLLRRLSEVQKPKVREALSTHQEQLQRALQLVSFRGDLPLTFEAKSAARKPFDLAAARALFSELEFYRLIQELPAPPPSPLLQNAVVIRDEAGLNELASLLTALERVAVLPAFHGEAHSAALQGLICVSGSALCIYVDVATAGAAAVARHLSASLSRAGLELVTHNGKALLHALASVGIEGVQLHTDVELLSYLLNPSRKEHSVAELARERLRLELPAYPLPGDATPAEVWASALAAAGDAVFRLTDDLWVEVEAMHLTTLAKELELPLIPILMQMERVGIRLDQDALAEISVQVDAEVESMLAEVYRLAGRTFNVGSPQQLAQVLYQDLKLPVLKKNKTSPSTDHEVLEKLAEEHPLPQAIIDYRSVAKLKSTYLDTLPLLVGNDGRVRTTFHQAAVATGRLSSTNPNLQNIPIRTELGRKIRRAFVAEPGWQLISADYSQIELRILAHIAGDEGLIQAFRDGADVHARTAAEVFGVAVDAVSSDQRRVAKMVNYGIAYGLSAHGLSTRLKIPPGEAQGIIERYFTRFPGIHRYIDDTIAKAKRTGYVESLFGRRRFMPDLVSRNRQVAMAAERAAINMPIQGTAADIVKRAMLGVAARFEIGHLRARMLLQVHDELLVEAPEAEVPAVVDLLREVMTSVAQLHVPLVVDVGQGKSWAQAH